MTGVVLYNPNESPVNTQAGQVDGWSWKYVENREDAERQIGSGLLLTVDVPAEGSSVNERALPAFQKYWEANRTFEEENKKVRDTEPVSPKMATQKKVKGTAKTNESEA